MVLEPQSFPLWSWPIFRGAPLVLKSVAPISQLFRYTQETMAQKPTGGLYPKTPMSTNKPKEILPRNLKPMAEDPKAIAVGPTHQIIPIAYSRSDVPIPWPWRLETVQPGEFSQHFRGISYAHKEKRIEIPSGKLT